ncbi:hypothetical protein EAS61_28685 [Bradyrhizobium zhanjiangense]|uniref:Uncharacterized protein n=1 Tax=Bradyrhizobium zhanjiangense TaxID=1325107 RepID=A0A4Q0SQ13_9BRAD|nr:hypothetical protein EAS61_28685 [Bradyrhizobium zhanjiangense]RXG99292.1 hypothetical protein EAS62_04360 [Bradyrhizobium zhanjiangense]RXH40529.1 hypothetical protein XH94_12110 [Bradyrhizobium zhanjiangense]
MLCITGISQGFGKFRVAKEAGASCVGMRYVRATTDITQRAVEGGPDFASAILLTAADAVVDVSFWLFSTAHETCSMSAVRGDPDVIGTGPNLRS